MGRPLVGVRVVRLTGERKQGVERCGGWIRLFHAERSSLRFAQECENGSVLLLGVCRCGASNLNVVTFS